MAKDGGDIDDESAKEKTRPERTVLPRITIAALRCGGCRRNGQGLSESWRGGGLARTVGAIVGGMLQALCMAMIREHAPLLRQTLEGCGARWRLRKRSGDWPHLEVRQTETLA
jgi:hypothetical protein